jgi:hypothetical protein
LHECRIPETSGWGPIALDVAYLLAPFPSCWCFAGLPAEVAVPTLLAYRDQVTNAGLDLGPDWELPRLRALAEAIREQLRLRWPDAVVPDYPALARPGAPIARRPSSWDPD